MYCLVEVGAYLEDGMIQHGDVRPQNVMYDAQDNSYRLVDTFML